VAWGSYWSWDPKETLTLLLFIAVSASLIVYFEKKLKIATGLSVISCILSVITASSSIIIAGLHSFA
jgi:ABC-type transport system involved in cytochrome c biogenesis permease subunit